MELMLVSISITGHTIESLDKSGFATTNQLSSHLQKKLNNDLNMFQLAFLEIECNIDKWTMPYDNISHRQPCT